MKKHNATSARAAAILKDKNLAAVGGGILLRGCPTCSQVISLHEGDIRVLPIVIGS